MSAGIVITIANTNQKLFLSEGESFFRLLIKEGLFDTENCGGRGVCGRCRVRFLTAAPLPTPSDRRCFTPQELREGVRLLCKAKPVKDCSVMLEFKEERKTTILDKASGAVQAMLEKVCEHSDGIEENKQIIITDLGTTTIVMQLIEAKTGRVIDTFRALNPQRKYGADVISRMEHAMNEEEKELAECVRAALRQGAESLGGNPSYMALAGNTVMIHLLMEYSVKGLAKEPFEPVDITEIRTKLTLKDGRELLMILAPGLSAFVGGDIFAGIYAAMLLNKSQKKKTTLLIDLGTNGELALMTENDIYTTATAAGPAFEGGATAGIWGADMVDITADLYANHILDSFGTMKDMYLEKGILVGKVYITQEDIRALQLAKAAIRAGISVLCKQANIAIEAIESVYLAGGFGYYLDCKKAGMIGLLPKELVEKAISVGNTALIGTFCMYRGNSDSCVMQKIYQAKSFNLAKIPDFEAEYIKYINFETDYA